MANVTDSINLKMSVTGKAYQDHLKKMERDTKGSTGRMSGMWKKMKAGPLAYAAAITAAVAAVGKFVSQAMIQERAEKQLAVAMKQSGKFAAGASKDIIRYAAELQKVSLVGDEVSIKVAQVGVAVGNLGNKQLKPFMQLSADVAAGTSRNIERVARTLAGMLNDPATAMTSLKTLGIELDEADKEYVKTLVDKGKKLEAQTFLMEKLTDQYKGQAKAQTEGLGIYGQLGNQISDLGDAIGKVLGYTLLPFARGLLWIVEIATKVVDSVGEMIKKFRAFQDATVGRVFDFFKSQGAPIDGAAALGIEGGETPRAAVTFSKGFAKPTVETGPDAEDKADAQRAANEEAKALADEENENLLMKERGWYERRYGIEKDMTAKERDLAKLRLKYAKAVAEGKYDLAREYKRQIEGINASIERDEENKAKAIVATNLRMVTSQLRQFKGAAKVMDKIDAGMTIATLARDMATKPAEAFAATVGKGGFWAWAAAISVAAATAAQLVTASARLGGIKGFRFGGVVPGNPATGDSVPILARPQEEIISVADRQRIVDMLARGSGQTAEVKLELVGDAGKLIQAADEDRVNEGF